MLRSIKDLLGYPVKALDGNIGKVADSLFDETTWTLSHLVLDTGYQMKLNIHYISQEEKEQTHRRVIVEPSYLDKPETGRFRRHLPVKLTKDSIRQSSGIESNPPRSLEYQKEFTHYYRHIPYAFYDRPAVWSPIVDGYDPPESNLEHTPEELNRHEKRLQEIASNQTLSCREILGYHVECMDCERGLVEDMIVNDKTWRIIAMAIRYGHWPKSEHKLFSVRHVTKFDWTASTVTVDFSGEEIESVPDFDPHAPINHGEADEIEYDYYGKPV